MGFVDDTSIVTYSETTEGNCRELERVNTKCLDWARKHGAVFAPEKYQLIHFTRARKQHNLQATVNIPGFTEGPVPELRLLGVQLDSKLKWGPHVKKAIEKGKAQMASLTALSKSTWGATFNKAKHLYSAIVRPAMTYGSPVWYSPEGTEGHKAALHKGLQVLQNQALRAITGAYRTTPTVALHFEAGIAPINHHLAKTAFQHAQKGVDSEARADIQHQCQKIAQLIRRKRQTQGKQSRRPQQTEPIATLRTQSLVGAAREEHRWANSFTAKGKWTEESWRKEWEAQREARRAKHQGRIQDLHPTWSQEWSQKRVMAATHKQLTRAQSTMATIMRTGHIGLASYLYNRKVPEYSSPACSCGFQKQDARHILLLCPEWAEGRSQMTQRAGSTNFQEIMTCPEGIKAATKWMITRGILEQFSLAREIEARKQAGDKGDAEDDEEM